MEIDNEVVSENKEFSLEFEMSSPTFCHGYSSLLILLKEIERLENNNKYNHIILSIIKKIEKYKIEDELLVFKDIDYIYKNDKLSKKEYKNNNIGILKGTISVLLSLMEIIDDNITVLSDIFLLNLATKEI